MDRLVTAFLISHVGILIQFSVGSSFRRYSQDKINYIPHSMLPELPGAVNCYIWFSQSSGSGSGSGRQSQRSVHSESNKISGNPCHSNEQENHEIKELNSFEGRDNGSGAQV